MTLVILPGWVNRRHQEVIDYLRTENQILKDTCGKKRIRLTDGLGTSSNNHSRPRVCPPSL